VLLQDQKPDIDFLQKLEKVPSPPMPFYGDLMEKLNQACNKLMLAAIKTIISLHSSQVKRAEIELRSFSLQDIQLVYHQKTSFVWSRY